ncbi:MAG: hypothetical protein FWB99_01185 [Treponema sp.]|nr:hypothetical protein [Treponema sp.]
MTRIDRMISDLQKLYAKRSAVDTQIQGVEAALIAEATTAARPAAKAEKPAAEKAAKKPAAEKKPAAAKKPAK